MPVIYFHLAALCNLCKKFSSWRFCHFKIVLVHFEKETWPPFKPFATFIFLKSPTSFWNIDTKLFKYTSRNGVHSLRWSLATCFYWWVQLHSEKFIGIDLEWLKCFLKTELPWLIVWLNKVFGKFIFGYMPSYQLNTQTEKQKLLFRVYMEYHMKSVWFQVGGYINVVIINLLSCKSISFYIEHFYFYYK